MTPQPPLDAATRSRLARGEVIVESEDVPGSRIPRVRATAMIDAPPERVWPLIDRCGEYKHTLYGIKDSQELWRRGDKVRVRLTIGMPFPLKDLISITEGTHTVVPGQKWVRRWVFVEGDYRHHEGSWTLLPFDDEQQRTLLRYEIHVEPTIRIPKALQKAAQNKALPKLIEQLRRRAGC